MIKNKANRQFEFWLVIAGLIIYKMIKMNEPIKEKIYKISKVFRDS